MRPSFFHHLHPPTIPARQSRWRYTLGAGGTAVFLVSILIITGMLELFYYVPTPEQAALSVQTITYHVPLGALIRNLHFWSAQLLIVVITVHLIRVVFTGAYTPPRRFNYLLGMTLFFVALMLNFTGYILRWDEGIQWALVVGTNLIKTIPLIGDTLYIFLTGSSEVSGATLTRFFAWHVFGLALVIVFLIGWHIFRLRRDGGIAVPPPKFRMDESRITRYDLVRRESLAMLFITAALILFSLIAPAPIAPPITDLSANVADNSAPWFFLWVQAMLKWGDPLVWGVIVPLLVFALIIFIPYIFPKTADAELGRWFPRSNRVAQIVVFIVALVVLVLTLEAT